jgi:O-antigen/teichoic acid export membrane protein
MKAMAEAPVPGAGLRPASAISFRVFNMGLRGLALVAKFALLFLLARFLSPAEVGLYGLVAATVMYVQYALGFDFCKYANREFIVAGPDRRPAILRDQAVFYLFTYSIAAPAVLLLFAFGLLPWNVAAWFFLLLTLEHIAHEAGRVLIAMSQQVMATFTLFLRAGAWVAVLAPALWLEPRFRTLDCVLAAWAAGAAAACLLSVAVILRRNRHGPRGAVDWAWIRRGIVVAAPFLVSTLALKAMSTLDRYVMESIAGLEALAAYVLFAGMAASVKAFLDSGVFAFAYPGLVESATNGNVTVFRRGMKALAWQTLLVAGAVTIVAIALIDPLLAWIGHDAYQRHLPLFYWTLAAMNLQAIGMIAYYGNYAHRRDAAIVTSQILGLATFLVATYALRQRGAIAVPIGLCIGQAATLTINWVVYSRLQPAALPPRG